MLKLILITYSLASFCLCCRHSEENKGRLFGGTYISTITQSKEVTSLVPSSCIQVASTLPACRNVRFMKFPIFNGFPFYDSPNEDNINKLRTESGLYTTPLGWGEYLGLYAPTATLTVTEINVITVQDPRTVVTFAIKGCKPLRLPANFNKCPEETSSIYIEEILSTSSISARTIPSSWFLPSTTQSVEIFSTSIFEIPNGEKVHEINFIEPSSQETEKFAPSIATEPL